MSGDNKHVKLSLTVTLNKEKNKVLYAVADSNFADILLSFLTLPLGRILKVLEKHYGDEAPAIGSLSSLYHSLANLDTSHFVTEGAKETLLNPTSSFEAEYEKLKLDFTDSQPAEYFFCSKCTGVRFRSVSIYYDEPGVCFDCHGLMSKEVVKKRCEADFGGLFTTNTASFIISDDLQILSRDAGFFKIIHILGVTNTDGEPIKVDLGLSEIMKLLKASLTSPTPLSDIILNKTTSTQMNNTPVVGSGPKKDNPTSRSFSLKVVMQKSRGKLLFVEAKEDFVEFLFSLLIIPLGGVEHLLAGDTCFKAINNLYRSTSDLEVGKHFKSKDVKDRLMKPNLPHGCMSESLILPLTEQRLPYYYGCKFSSVKFPKGQGSYLQRQQPYLVKDDLTVLPYCFVTILSSLKEQKIPVSDVEEVELKIGLKEALSILKASLTSTSALSDALQTRLPNKQQKRELSLDPCSRLSFF